MKHHAVLTAVIALSLTSTSLIFAQGNSHQTERARNNEQHSRSDPERQNPHAMPNPGRNEQAHRDHQPPRAQQDHRKARGAGPHHDFYRGKRLPKKYRHQTYVVQDWRGHRLHAPPRSHRWVRTGRDFVLIESVSGIIVQIVFGR